MYKSMILLFSILLPLMSAAAKGDFDFLISGEKIPVDYECIESIHYLDKDEVEAENLFFTLTDACGKKLSTITRQNIGKKMSITYNGNKITSALLVSTLSTSFRVSTKDIPRVILMQILDDPKYSPD